MPQIKKPIRSRVPTQNPPSAEVRVTSDTIRMMMHDTRFLNNFPFLKQAKAQATAKGKCGCGSPRVRMTEPNLALMRQKLANMPAAKKIKLKQLLGAKQVTIKYPRPVGGPVVKRF